MAVLTPRWMATIIWASLVLGVTMFLGVALYVVFGVRGGAAVETPPTSPAVLVGVSLGVSVVTIALSWLWAVRRKASGSPLRTRGGGTIPAGPEAAAIRRLVVAGALCELGALAAAVVFLLTGQTSALAPYALSWLALAAHFPGDRHWAQLTGVPEGATRSPMIRG